MKYFIKRNLINIIRSPSAYIPITRAILNKLFLSEKIHFNYQNEGVYLCTAPDAPKGTGTRIMIKSEVEMKNAGFSIFYVTVFEKNVIALNFYNKFGFKAIAAYKTSRGKKILMSKELI
ncbi:MAG: GNAT family N-acetyltransferase [Rhodoferax sp.]|nr:GNAT family N-acetyltransferase [Rhodoferax sp.]